MSFQDDLRAALVLDASRPRSSTWHVWAAITPPTGDADEAAGCGMQQKVEYTDAADLVARLRGMLGPWNAMPVGGWSALDEWAVEGEREGRRNAFLELVTAEGPWTGHGIGLQLGLFPCDRHGTNVDVALNEPTGE